MAGKKARKPADGSYSQAWRNFSKIILRPGIRMMMRLDWHGQENIPADGPVILAANHLSYMDIFAVSLFADSARRYPVFLAKSSLFTIPVVGPLISRLGQLPVYRGQADAALVLKQAAELAARNSACVIFYPEATVTRDPEQWPMVAKTGVARLALERDIPVVPIAHWGAQRILPYGKFVPQVPAAQDGPDRGRAAGRPVGVRRPAAEQRGTAGRHRQDHDGRSGAARRAARPDPARRVLPPGGRPPEAAPGSARAAGSERQDAPARQHGSAGGRDRAAGNAPAAVKAAVLGAGVLGHDFRPGALRRRDSGHAVVPPARAGRDHQLPSTNHPITCRASRCPQRCGPPPTRPRRWPGADLVVLAVPAQTLRHNLIELARAAAAGRRCWSA